MFRRAEKFSENKAQGPVVDLDALTSQEQYVKLHGVTHTIKPVLVEEFYALANAWARIQMLGKETEVTFDQMVDAYHSVIFPLCPTVTKEILLKCTASQLSALLQYIVDHQNGRLDEKKKMMTPLPLPGKFHA